MKLYNYWRSSSSHRVRIALSWKGIPYEYVVVNLLAHEQLRPEHRARSPMGKVPVLELDDGRLLTESMAILEHLEDTHPDPPLLPRDPYARGRARMLAEMVNSGIQPLQNFSLLMHLRNDLHVDAKAWIARWVGGGLEALERAVAATAGRFCVGDEPTIADACLVPEMTWARRNAAVDFARVPRLVAIEAACAELPAFAASAPGRQPDAPAGAG